MANFFKKQSTKKDLSKAESPILGDLADVTVKFSENTNNFNVEVYNKALRSLSGEDQSASYTKEQIKNSSIDTCRMIAGSGQGFVAVNKIVNEAIVIDEDSKLVSINFKNLIELDLINESQVEILSNEFQKMLLKLNFTKQAKSLFRHFYIDGRLHLYKIRDGKTKQVIGIKRIDPTLITIRHDYTRKLYDDISTIDLASVNKYYKIKDVDSNEERQIPFNEIASCYSNCVSEDGQVYVSNLMPCAPYANKLRIMEEAVVIATVNNSTKRTMWQVDLDNVPRNKQSEFLNTISASIKTESAFNCNTGMIDSAKAFPSTSEDIVLPVFSSNSITTKEIGNDKGSSIDSKEIEHLQRQLTECLIVPSSRYDSNSKWQVGADNSITRQEIEFSKLIKECLVIFSEVLQDLFIDYLESSEAVDDSIINILVEYQNSIGYNWNSDRYFEEMKKIDDLANRASAYASFRDLINSKVISANTVAELILGDKINLVKEQEIIKGDNDARR